MSERHNLTLSFVDEQLERDYRAHELGRNIRFTRIGLIIGLAVLVFYALRDAFLGDSLLIESSLRIYVAIPAVFTALLVSMRPGPRTYLWVVACLTVMILIYPTSLATGGAEYTNAIAFSYVQAILFLNILVMAPFRYCVPVSALTGAVMIAALLLQGAETVLTKQLVTIVAVVCGTSCFVVWGREYSARYLFLRQQELAALNLERMSQQANRIDWLRNLPVHLSRDIQNRLFAIEADVERELDQAGGGNERLERVLKRINVLMDTLESTSFARDLQERELSVTEIDVGELVSEVATFRARDVMDKCTLEVWAEDKLMVHADRELLTGAVQQLLNSATAELEVDSVVSLHLFEEDGRAVLELRLLRDFPAEGAAALTDQELRAGLGIFVAGKVLELHGGELRTVNRAGTSFLRGLLPLADELDSPINTVTSS